MPSNLFDDDGGELPPNRGPVELEVDHEYRRRLERRREAEDLRRFQKAVADGEIIEDDDEEDESDSEESGPEEEIGVDEVAKWIDSLNKLQKHDPEFLATGETDGLPEKKDREKKKKKKKKMYLKDVQANQLLKDGPDAGEEDEGRSNRVQSYGEQQEELRRAVSEAVEAGGEEESDDDEDLLKVKEGGDDDDDSEEDEELKEMADEYFGKELSEGDKFLRDYLLKQMWKDKDGKSKTEVIDEAELQQISDDEKLVIVQEEFETKYRHEEKDVAGGIVMGQSRLVEGSVRRKDSARKTQRKNKEERQKLAEIERQEELKRLKNVKKNEIKERMKKVLSIAGFKEGEEFPLNARNLDDEFDPEEYDKMMKAAFDDEYYGAEDAELHSDDDDDEKPDFDKEDELLGLPKNWDVIQSGDDGFKATREKVLKQKEDVDNDDEEPEEEEEEEVDEEEEREGKRKRKRKASLVKRAKEALMEEYYKLDYEDTIGDLKTRFKFAKVQPNSYGLEKEEILFLDDTELNQYVPLKKMAPYMEKDWEVNKYKLKEQKHKFSELLERIDHPEEKGSKKKSKNRDREEKKKKNVIEEKKPAAPIADEEGEAETSKLSRKAKRRRREAEKKLPPNRMVAYGKTN